MFFKLLIYIEKMRLEVRSASRPMFYHYEGPGSTRALSDTAGSLVRQYGYEAFGELLNETGTIENNYLFTGEQRELRGQSYGVRS